MTVKKILLSVWETLKIVLVALVIVIPIRYFLFQPFLVKGQSMEPNFKDGNYLIVDEISYRFRSPERGEVVVFKYPQDPSQRFIKRIIGLPGETINISDGRIMIGNGEQSTVLAENNYLSQVSTFGNINITLGRDEFFVLGDNRDFSYDSRRFGILPKYDIIGRVLIRAWPVNSLEIFNTPSY